VASQAAVGAEGASSCFDAAKAHGVHDDREEVRHGEGLAYRKNGTVA